MISMEKKGFFPSLKAVKLEGYNILTENANRTITYLKLLNPDRMLYNFRKTFGQDTKGVEPLGGWDEPTGLLRGHSTGHYLSGLAIAYGSYQDPELKERIDYMVSELGKLQALSKGRPQDFVTQCSPTDAAQDKWSTDPSTWGEGFISAYSPDQFALLEQFTPYTTIWAPYYTLHKLLAGFLDCYTYASSEQALEIAKGIGSWVYERLSALDEATRVKMWTMHIAGEYGGLNESLSHLYLITRDDIYKDAAALFYNQKVFDGLAEGKDTITGIHANQHIPQMIGAMLEYEVRDDIKYYNIGYNFWDIVTKHYAYSIGGVGRGESFKEPDILAANIEADRNCETCASYNMLKLTKLLYSYNPDKVEYMDYYERTLLNHIIASQNPIVREGMHHGVTYMLPIGPGQVKSYGGDYDCFTCCHGTGMENHVKYQESIYFTSSDDSTLYINLYLPSTFNWDKKAIKVKQSQSFPSEQAMIQIEGQGEFTLKLRIPHWAKDDFTIKLNGSSVEWDNAQGYVTITREWNTGDIIEINMPFKLRIEKTKDKLDNLDVGSILYGPLVMVALDPSTDFITLQIPEKLEDAFTIEKPSYEDIKLRHNGLEFIPIYQAHHIAYHTYFKLKNN